MATKFSTVYRQELKNKGVLASLGAAAGKGLAERMDIRNLLFSGQGFLGSTGQKIFGKGYSPIRKSGVKVSGLSDTPSVELTSLQQSNERQEALLKVVAKNTFNMNMMARDMNITRQNIASLTKSVTGKSSKGADALWMGAAKRDSLLSSAKAAPQTTTPQKTTGSTSSFLGGIVGGLAGLGGGVGSVIFRALGSVIAIAPLLGIVGIAASAYAIKEMSKGINFGGIFDSIQKSIADFLGVDLESEEPVLKQLAKKLNNLFATTKFTDIYDWVEKTFGDDFKAIRKMISDGTKITMDYTKAAFITLGENFGKIGEMFGYHFSQFINQYKPAIFATMGAAIGASVGSLLGLKGAGLGLVIGAGAGWILGKLGREKTIADLEEEVSAKQEQAKKLESLMIKNEKGEFVPRNEAQKDAMISLQSDIMNLQAEIALKKQQKEQMTLGNLPLGANFNKNLEQVRADRERGEGTPSSGGDTRALSPTRVDHSPKAMIDLIRSKFLLAGYSEEQAMAAVANAIQESRLNPLAKSEPPEKSYGLFQINTEAHPGYTKEQLLDPEKNIDAMLKIMKTDYAEDDKIFRTINDVEKATRYFGLRMSRPFDRSEGAMQKRVANLQRIPGLMLDQKSQDLAATTRGFSAPSSAPAIPVPPSPPNQQAAAPKTSTPQVANPDTIELFFNLAFAGTTR